MSASRMPCVLLLLPFVLSSHVASAHVVEEYTIPKGNHGNVNLSFGEVRSDVVGTFQQGRANSEPSGGLAAGMQHRKAFHAFLTAEDMDVSRDEPWETPLEEMGLEDQLQYNGKSRRYLEETYPEDDTDEGEYSEEFPEEIYNESRQTEHSKELSAEGDSEEEGLDEIVHDERMYKEDREGNFIQRGASNGSEENEERPLWPSGEISSSQEVIRETNPLLFNPLGGGSFLVDKLGEANFNDMVNDKEYVILSFLAEGCDKCELFRPHFASAAKKFWEIEEEREGQTVFFYEVNDPQLMVKFNLRELPTVFFFRNGIPILYEGNLNTESLARWIFNHMEVMGWEMQDDNFDVETQRKNEDGSSVTWIVHFCNVDTPGCDGFMATWESAAYRLKGVVEFGYVDVAIEITLAKRLNIDMNNLPAVILIKDNQLFWCTLPLMELTTDSIIHFVTKGHLQIEEEQLPSKLSALAALIVRAGANINAIVATVIATTVVFYGIYIYIRRRKRLADMGKEKGV